MASPDVSQIATLIAVQKIRGSIVTMPMMFERHFLLISHMTIMHRALIVGEFCACGIRTILPGHEGAYGSPSGGHGALGSHTPVSRHDIKRHVPPHIYEALHWDVVLQKFTNVAKLRVQLHYGIIFTICFRFLLCKYSVVNLHSLVYIAELMRALMAPDLSLWHRCAPLRFRLQAIGTFNGKTCTKKMRNQRFLKTKVATLGVHNASAMEHRYAHD